ncbi:MAG: 3-isopropylmalate dehydratase small subunit [Nitrososphaeraceae archaeon]|nr:3-isopropylmalate dehydratase small subunit [Nitrososphaeraceae archaeon]
MKIFKTITSQAVPLPLVNIDTDQIIPKQFLKLIQKTGFGKFLFYDWRYDSEGNKKDDFVLNNPKYNNRQILLTLDNFGSGSSREHAVWAISDYGFKIIIAPSFADIFYNNCIKNCVLPIILSKPHIQLLFDNEDIMITVDLEKQQITANSITIPFKIDPSSKIYLLEGSDEISKTLKLESEISNYETNHPLYTNISE